MTWANTGWSLVFSIVFAVWIRGTDFIMCRHESLKVLFNHEFRLTFVSEISWSNTILSRKRSNGNGWKEAALQVPRHRGPCMCPSCAAGGGGENGRSTYFDTLLSWLHSSFSAGAVAKMQDAKMKQPPYWRMVHELYRMFNCLVYLVRLICSADAY